MAIQTFTAAQVLTAAQMNTLQANDYNQTVSNKTASYTLVAADKGTRVVMNVASANTVTVNTSLFSAGDTLVIQNIGAGVTTVTAGTATVSSAGPLAIPQNGSGMLYFTSAGVSIFYPSAVTVAAPTPSGLTFIGGGALSSTTTTFSNVFSATYNAYRILLINMTMTQNVQPLKLQFGSTNTGYEQTSMYCNNTTAWTFSGSATTFAELGYMNSTDQTTVVVDVVSPFLSAQTFFTAVSTGYSTERDTTLGCQDSSTSFTAFTIFNTQSATMTGTVQIFGYSNS